MKSYLLIIALILSGCATKSAYDHPTALISMQLIDRNGFSETISSKDRLSHYHQTDFETPQPYKKILRVFERDKKGKSSSKITSYHDNGQIAQRLDVVDGRAQGLYREWHSNANLKLEAHVIEGMADIHELAQTSWLFDGKSRVWDEQGNLIAEISYSKGALETPSLYYHPNGVLSKSVPFHQNEMDGMVTVYDEEGMLLEKASYQKGKRHGPAESQFYREEYSQGLLFSGSYYSASGEVISQIQNGNGEQALFKEGELYSLIEHQNGRPEGLVQLFSPTYITYFIKDGKKTGEECEYFFGTSQKKISFFWQEDALQGIVKTWYENGNLESQKEIDKNKKQGLCFAWYRDGQLMLMEEYDQNILVKGSYFKKGDKTPFSKVEEGSGVATLHSPDGHFLKKIIYEKGKPSL